MNDSQKHREDLLINEPLVSVGIPTYNQPEGLRRTLECILGQTYKNLEITISDNCSSNLEVERVGREYANKDLRVKYVRQEKNIGMLNNLEYVLKAAYGEYFMWAADDDFWDPRFISSLVTILQNNIDGNVAMCAIKRITEDGKPYDILRFPYLLDLKNYNFLKVGKKIIAGEKLNIFICGIFRRPFLKSILKNTLHVNAADRILILQLSLHSRLLYVDEILFTKRLSYTSIKDRYQNEEIGQQYNVNFLYTRYVFLVCTCLITSDIIPRNKKKYIPLLISYQLFSIGTISLVISEFTSFSFGFLRKLRKGLQRT